MPAELPSEALEEAQACAVRTDGASAILVRNARGPVSATG